jgi:hypothetical protein
MSELGPQSPRLVLAAGRDSSEIQRLPDLD